MMLPIELTKILYAEWDGQLDTPGSDGQLYGKCLNGPGKVKFKNGNSYRGGFLDGMLHGVGKFQWANGIVYEGQFKHNRLEGQGTYRWTDGSIYQGQVKDGLRHGQGKLTLQDCTYDGAWVEGSRHGKGKVTFNNGGIYEGEFKNGLKHGHGKMYYPSGNFYEGQWKEDKKNGQGVMHWIDSREKYTGEWINNQQHGWGIHLWLDSRGEGKFMRNRYEGEWKNGLRDGFGTFYYANGSKYEGTWLKNMKQGYAFFTDELGRVTQRQFKNDRMVKQNKVEEKTDKKSPDKIDKKRVSVTDGSKTNRPNQSDVTNPYAVMLHVQPFFRPTNPNLQQLYNCLLRNNSQLKSWYKGLSSFYDNHSEFYFSLMLQNVWKMVRSLKVLGRVSLAQIDRNFWGYQINAKKALPISQKYETKVPLYDLYYFDQSNNIIDGFNIAKISDYDSQNTVVDPLENLRIHDSQRIVLLSDLVQILIYVAIRLEPNMVEPHKSVEKFLVKIGPSLQVLSRGDKKSTQQSENMSSVSRTEKSAPIYAKNFNSKLFKKICQLKSEICPRNRIDDTVTMSHFIHLLKTSGIFVDSDCAALEKLLQKHFQIEYLATATGGSQKLSSKLLLLANYELIEFQFTELLFYYLVKKLPSTKDTQDNRNKYEQFIKKIESAAKILHHNRKNEIAANKAIRINHSNKMQLKAKMKQRRQGMEKQRLRRDAVLRERQRQAKQCQLMSLNDINIVEETFDEEDNESEY